MLNIAVVDDEQVHRDILMKYIEEWKAREGVEAQVEDFPSGEAFYFSWCGDQRWDVLFLDICMEGETAGVMLAKKLREKKRAIVIIFTTGIPDYMQEGFEVEALHYLLKPLDKRKVWECLDKCFRRTETERRTVLLPIEEGTVKVDGDKILYAEAVGHYCTVTCAEEVLEVRMGIRELERKLRESMGIGEGQEGYFVFTHRSYLVNVQKIARMGRQDILMDNGVSVPVSRRSYNQVNDRFIALFLRPERA